MCLPLKYSGLLNNVGIRGADTLCNRESMYNCWLPPNSTFYIQGGGECFQDPRGYQNPDTQVHNIKRHRTMHTVGHLHLNDYVFHPTKNKQTKILFFNPWLNESMDLKPKDVESLLYIYWKKSTCKQTHTVQAHAVPESIASSIITEIHAQKCFDVTIGHHLLFCHYAPLGCWAGLPI